MMALAQAQQSPPPISTDRPTESVSPGTVPRGLFQFETGWKLDNDGDGAEEVHTQSFPDLLFRYGITGRFETRVTMAGFNVKSFADPAAGQREAGFTDVSLGVKGSLLAEEGWRPALGLLVDVSVPVGEQGFSNEYVIPKVLLLASNTLSDRLGLTYNVGPKFVTLDDEAGARRTVVDLDYVAALSSTLTPKTTVFGEFWGTFALHDTADDRHSFQAGFIGRLTNNTQLDVRAGVGLVEGAAPKPKGTPPPPNPNPPPRPQSVFCTPPQ
jgi:hypothetical protein